MGGFGQLGLYAWINWYCGVDKWQGLDDHHHTQLCVRLIAEVESLCNVFTPLWTEEYYKYVTDSLNVRQILERRVCGICGDNIILGTRLPLCTAAKEEGPKRISSSSSYSWPQSMRTESRRTDCVEFVIVAVFMQKVTSYNNAVLHSSDDDHWPLWPGGGCDGMGIFAGTDCGQRQLQPVRQRKQ